MAHFLKNETTLTFVEQELVSYLQTYFVTVMKCVLNGLDKVLM